MKRRELINLGFGHHRLIELATAAVAQLEGAGERKNALRLKLADLAKQPAVFLEDPILEPLARQVLALRTKTNLPETPLRKEPAPYRIWNAGDIDDNALRQMDHACSLPVAVAGALMPDAHVGYGLPIGGVLATRNTVIPYAVGVDIACRVKLTVLEGEVGWLQGQRDRLRQILERETRFGVGAVFRDRREHAVMDEDWRVSPVTARGKDKAWAQLGTSGSGNHFVEFGEFSVGPDAHGLGLEPGTYLALLSHSGSRGTGAAVCDHYSRVAMDSHPDLPKELKHLAWLDLKSQEGREYWLAMNLMGQYAAANHALIHRHIAKALGTQVLLDIENHHNFAWQEEHGGETLIVHRKGATPAGKDVLGIIPGSMASPAYVVRGKGHPLSLDSASHGAGRLMSRKKATESFTWSEAKKLLHQRQVELLSAGIDEVPMVYRDIDSVMAAQDDLVEKLARFFPRLVKMAPAGEKPED